MVLRRAHPVSLCALLSILLAGCGSAKKILHSLDTPSSGSVHGGQQPVVGATIQLYTVGTTAVGSAATQLLTSTVTSDANGNFTITGLYSCTNATQVYIVATGGNPGLRTTNPNIALMAALGPCSSLTSSTFININELTTVAAVSALAPYMSSATAIGSPSDIASTTSLDNAFTIANQLVNTATGFSPGANVPSGYTVPTAELNTLADILAACINSTGGTAGDGSLCGNLFSLTTISPNPAPTDTIQAMLNIAYNTGLNTAALYALTPPTPPFQPTLPSAPSDFSISVQGLPIQAIPSAINFLNVTVASTSAPQTVTIQNVSAAGGIANIRIIEPNPTDFSVGDALPTQVGYCPAASVPPGQSCWVQVSVRPSVAGIRNAFLAVDYNSGASTVFIPLSATGIPANPGSFLSSTFVNFPPTIAGSNSAPIPVTVSNPGPGNLTISAISVNGALSNNFAQTNNCAGVAVGANCTIYVAFAPANSGVQSATLQVTSIESGSNTVALSGTGVSLGTAPSLWPSYLTYTIWGANEDLVVTNSGTTAMSISGIGAVATGGNFTDHEYVTPADSCSPTLAADASCTFTLANIANDPLSTYTSGFGSVTGQAYVHGTSLTSNILSENYAYLFQTGSGINGNGISGTITFPTVSVGSSGTATIQLQNIGSGSPAASLAIYGANPGDFSVSAVQPTVSSTPSSFCPAATTGTQPCTITVTFTPTAAGTRTAKISLDANGSQTGQFIFVTGAGQ